MSSEIVLHPSSDTLALAEKQEQLAAVRVELAEMEAEMAQYRAQLKSFEGRYLRQVGVLYAELDELEARITEHEAKLYDSDGARQRAEEARQRAQESHDAAFGEASEAEEFDPPANLKTLFRDVAKRIHPDFAKDDAEREYFTLLMARANQAYRRGDVETLQRMLYDHTELHSVSASESVAAELLRIARQIQHAKRDVAALETERYMLRASEIALLFHDAETAALEHRDLLTELATGVREQIVDAQRRFDLIDRQINVHGR